MKFSIRDLLLVTVIVGMGLAWWTERRTLTSRVSRLQEENAEFAWRTDALTRAVKAIGWEPVIDDSYGLKVSEPDQYGPSGWRRGVMHTLGADAVIGVKVFIHEIGSRRNSQVRIQVEQLIPQAVIRGRDTFIDATFQQAGKELERK